MNTKAEAVLNPNSEAERTEANEANEGQMDAGRQPERLVCKLAAGKSLLALFSSFPSVNPTSEFGLKRPHSQRFATDRAHRTSQSVWSARVFSAALPTWATLTTRRPYGLLDGDLDVGAWSLELIE
jgi:hypothetical protein